MSTCNCDGTIGQTFTETLFGDSLISSVNIDPLSGGFDPRPNACQEAVGELRAEGQDPCNLDSPDDLQVLYKQYILGVTAIGGQTPTSNALQKAADVALGTATPSTPVVSGTPKPPASKFNYGLIAGFLLILAFGFFLVFR